jgi:hypothetical protein
LLCWRCWRVGVLAVLACVRVCDFRTTPSSVCVPDEKKDTERRKGSSVTKKSCCWTQAAAAAGRLRFAGRQLTCQASRVTPTTRKEERERERPSRIVCACPRVHVSTKQKDTNGGVCSSAAVLRYIFVWGCDWEARHLSTISHFVTRYAHPS